MDEFWMDRIIDRHGKAEEDKVRHPNNVDAWGNETITITKIKYQRLIDSARKLKALEMGGVDNWQGYDQSIRDFFNDQEQH